MYNLKQKIVKNLAVSAIIIVSFSGNAALASEITSEKMLELTNGSRIEAGLRELNLNDKLTKAAQAKAEDMFANQYFEHISPSGITPWHWFDLAGYDYIYAAENLAIDFTTAEGVHSALMKSTGHRENILGANYEEVGIAVLSGSFQGKTSIIVVEQFGTENKPKNIKITDPFFEKKSEREEVKSSYLPKEEIQLINEDVQDYEIYVDQETEDADIFVQEEEENARKADYGKVVPQAYAVRNAGTLKKVYVENIYWQEANRRGSNSPLAPGRAILKDVLNKFHSRLYAGLIGR